MRIAVCGTHCSGKTTLINEFLLAHPEFAYEPEPYTVLVEDYGEEFSSEPSVDDFYRQLEFNVQRLRHHSHGERVIFERGPVDFLAYILAIKDLNRDDVDSGLIKTALRLVSDGLRDLEMILFLPLDEADGIDVSDDQDPKLRMAVDKRLAAILVDDQLDVVRSDGAVIVEARGSTAERLKILQDSVLNL